MDMNKYNLMIAYNLIIGCYPTMLYGQIKQAFAENAPVTALYKEGQNWRTIDELQDKKFADKVRKKALEIE